MKVARRLGRRLALVVLCAVGLIGAGQAPAAFAADGSPYHTIFFGKELLAFQCALHGGTYYETGAGYGCHMADGGEVYCSQGDCWWWPAARTIDPKILDYLVTVVQPQVSGADPYPVGTKAGYEQVMGLDQAAKVTVNDVRLLTSLATPAKLGAVNQVVAVQSRSAALTADQIDAVMAGKGTQDARIVGTVTDPKPDTTMGDVVARMKVPGKRLLVIRGEILIDGLRVPILTIIVLVT
ncbi:hypothetical protein ACFFX1_45070 [Dactylosporangium sucinum]|uniref:Uncharacterized protein n=1 Tax=Dactylosporangium sucinum TaxID=1424081 RepID=A0A917U1M3_9ACTN|nr:hypothetical protein [Dactylosporangium sucinum]GGM48518.1 hypothetical protein GCM10007977_057650 [Dactylosporangium sucinum]